MPAPSMPSHSSTELKACLGAKKRYSFDSCLRPACMCHGHFLCMREERGDYLEGCANFSSRAASRVSVRKQTSASRKQITPARQLTVAILRVGSSLVSPGK